MCHIFRIPHDVVFDKDCFDTLTDATQNKRLQQKRPETRSLLDLTKGRTHTRELDATVTALRGSTLLLDVKVSQLAAGSLDDADLVGPRVVPIRRISSVSRP